MELYTSRLAAATAAGISKDTWHRVEEGEEVRESTYAKIDRALNWATGSCMTIAEGGPPVFADQPAASPPAADARLTEEQAREMAWDTAKETLPTAPLGELQAFVEGLVENLRRAGIVTNGS